LLGPDGRPEVRLVLAVSLDGRLAPAEGGAAQLGGPGDRRVLEEALAWADACLIGARTLRLHGTTCVIRDPGLLEQRSAEQRSPQPHALVVSRSAEFEAGLRFFQQPLQRWLLTPSPTPAAPPGFEQIRWLQSWPALLQGLAAEGLQRIVLLGGAALAAQLLELQLVDELQLTLVPRLLGGAHTWLPESLALAPNAWRLSEHRPLEGEEFLLRYRRIRA
jgi:5-amino-6-(5-phosphoribosylamino)uracil reductase